MITEHFNSRTVANMEVALEQAIRLLKKESEQHGAATDWMVTPGRFQPAPRTNRITKKIETAITTVDAKAPATRIAI